MAIDNIILSDLELKETNRLDIDIVQKISSNGYLLLSIFLIFAKLI